MVTPKRLSNIRTLLLLPKKKLPPQIQLTSWETKIFNFLRRVTSLTSTPSNDVELRIAGGWVRDKILNRDTGDIDIAVRNITGFQFATRIRAFVSAVSTDSRQPGQCGAQSGNAVQTVHGDTSIIGRTLNPKIGCTEFLPDMSSVAVIAANPAMSRHLETAKVRLDGIDFDFVQLRTEDYVLSADNRIPDTVSAGTPEQDSHRRDFTVNTLYYNIHTESVEDFTGYGLDDLRAGLLRTPLNASTTLLEDPLRALRAIRFACRLGFTLHATLSSALSSEQVRNSLLRKVSRERIGSEIWQIIQTDGVVEGLELITKYELQRPVFLHAFECLGNPSDVEFSAGVGRVKSALAILKSSTERPLNGELCEDFETYGRGVLVLAVLLWDTSRIRPMLQTALRRNKNLQQDVRRVILLSIELEDLVRQWYLVRDDSERQKEEQALWIDMAEIIREAGLRLWIAVVISCSVRIGRDGLLDEIVRAGIDSGVCNVSHAVNGKRLQDELGIGPGPEVGKALHELLRLQLSYYREGRCSVKFDEENDGLSSEDYLQLLKANRLFRR